MCRLEKTGYFLFCSVAKASALQSNNYKESPVYCQQRNLSILDRFFGKSRDLENVYQENTDCDLGLLFVCLVSFLLVTVWADFQHS